MMGSWSLVYEGFEPEQERLREALCTLGNGYFATRGASAQADADDVHYPGTYLAGGYNRLETDIAGRTIENEDLVNLPNWLPLQFRINGGEWFDIRKVYILNYRQELDMKQGLLKRIVRFRDHKGLETTLTERRLVHMANPHLAALECGLRAENWSGLLEVLSALDGRTRNEGVARYKKLNSKHLEPLLTKATDNHNIFLKVRTNQSEIQIALAARNNLFLNGKAIDIKGETLLKEGYVARRYALDLYEGSEMHLEKVVSLYTSRDPAVSECGLEAKKAITEAEPFDGLLESHALAWNHLWRRFDMSFQRKDQKDGNHTAMVLRLNIFHLLQTTSMHTMDLDVGVPSRGWHGEAYRGHVFWDELFIFPFLNLRVPEITRSLLMYRYRRLREARAAAAAEGYRGAMYPWQSGSNGREESQKLHLNPKSGRWIPDNSRLQRHVSAAIAHNVCQYYQSTGDMEFISFYGAEMVLEIARFWASMATYNKELDRYEILGVMGPDEYHEAYPDAKKPGLNNNAYTNIMAAWVMVEALNLLDILPEDRSKELRETIRLEQEEIERWQDISRKMRVAFHGDGIISQFEGYERLEEFDWEGYGKKYDDIQRLDRILEAEGDTPNRYKASKQADVLMLFYLFSAEELERIFERLGYPFERDTIPKNIQYYMQRTSHGSTLSRVVHSWVLVRSDRSRSWQLFDEALKSDYSDIQGGTTPEGIHLGAMAGSVNITQDAYTGIEPRKNVLWFNPCLPEEIGRLKMEIRYRGHTLEIEVASDKFTIRDLRCAEEPVKIGFNGETFEIRGKDSRTFDLKKNTDKS